MLMLKLLPFLVCGPIFAAGVNSPSFSVSEEYILKVRASINTTMKYAYTHADPVAETSFYISENAKTSGINLDVLLGGSGRSVERRRSFNDDSYQKLKKELKQLSPRKDVSPFLNVRAHSVAIHPVAFFSSKSHQDNYLFDFLLELKDDTYMVPSQLISTEMPSFLSQNKIVKEKMKARPTDSAERMAQRVRFETKTVSLKDIEFKNSLDDLNQTSGLFDIKNRKINSCVTSLKSNIEKLGYFDSSYRVNVQLKVIDLDRGSFQTLKEPMSDSEFRLPELGNQPRIHMVKIDHEIYGRGPFEDVIGNKVDELMIESINQEEIAINASIYLYKGECHTASEEALNEIFQKGYDILNEI